MGRHEQKKIRLVSISLRLYFFDSMTLGCPTSDVSDLRELEVAETVTEIVLFRKHIFYLGQYNDVLFYRTSERWRFLSFGIRDVHTTLFIWKYKMASCSSSSSSSSSEVGATILTQTCHQTAIQSHGDCFGIIWRVTSSVSLFLRLT